MTAGNYAQQHTKALQTQWPNSGDNDMTEKYGFNHELPSGQPCYVEADIEPLVPAHINCAPEDAYPAEGGYAEVTGVYIKTEQIKDRPEMWTEVDMADVWVRTRGDKVAYYLDALAETAYDEWMEEQ